MNSSYYTSSDEYDSNDSNNLLFPPGMNPSSNHQMEADSYDSCDLSAVSIMTDQSGLGMNHPALIYTYEVRFKTCTEQYLYHEKLSIGEMVTVQCERGYNIGFIDGEVLADPDNPPQKRILAKLIDEDNTIKDMLKFKITAEKNALVQCRMNCKGHRLGNFADSIAAEFQFDRKKLTVYLKKYEDVSVCRLVRKLYDTYKMRIKVLEVDDPETMKDMTKKYLELSKLNVPLSDAYNFDPSTSVLNHKNQGKQNKSDKHSPNFSKSHLGQSQHLIPSLVQYGPQADKRHNQMFQQNFFPPAPTTSNISQFQRSDRNNSQYRYGQVYESKYQHHAPSAPPQTYNNGLSHQYSTQPMPSWSSNQANQRGSWYGMDRQHDKYATNANGTYQHPSLEPFGHDDSTDVYRSHSEFPYQGMYEETFPNGEQHEDYFYSSRLNGAYRRQHQSTDNNINNDIEVLTHALARPTMEKNYSSIAPHNFNISTGTPSISIASGLPPTTTNVPSLFPF